MSGRFRSLLHGVEPYVVLLFFVRKERPFLRVDVGFLDVGIKARDFARANHNAHFWVNCLLGQSF